MCSERNAGNECSMSTQSNQSTGSASSSGIAHRRLRRKCEEVIDVSGNLSGLCRNLEQLSTTRRPRITRPQHPAITHRRSTPLRIRQHRAKQRRAKQHRGRINSISPIQTIPSPAIHSAMPIVTSATRSAMPIATSAMPTGTRPDPTPMPASGRTRRGTHATSSFTATTRPPARHSAMVDSVRVSTLATLGLTTASDFADPAGSGSARPMIRRSGTVEWNSLSAPE